MRWGAMLVVLGCMSSTSVLAGEASPLFGGAEEKPFQIAVNPDTGQPLVLTNQGAPIGQAAK